jgi:dihydropteroate synthase
MKKYQYPNQICPEYEESIWVVKEEEKNRVVLMIKAVRDADIFGGSLYPLGE